MEKIFIYNNKETNYIITSEGKIFNKKTKKELTGTYARNEYKSVQLLINGKPKSFMVHRLVAQMFCENPNSYDMVDHIDRNKHNNDYRNLRWVNNKINSQNREQNLTRRKNTYLKNINEKEWKDILNEPNYKINSCGHILNIKTHQLIFGSERNGYLRADLNGNMYSVHRLVWESFNGPIPEGMVIDHIDNCRQNNNLSNLQLLTQQENIVKTHSNHSKDIPVKQYNLHGKYIKTYSSYAEAGRAMDVTKEAIKNAVDRKGTCKKFFWLKQDEDIQKFLKETSINKPKKNSLAVDQYDLKGNFIASFSSISAAARKNNCSPSTIKRAIDGQRPGKGYIWILKK